jgi:dolichol-phosphate mannosyltransferase
LVYILFVIKTQIMQTDGVRFFGSETPPQLSIVIPTYNEAENIVPLLESIKSKISNIVHAEIIVVDDNSPDGTGVIVDNYIKNNDLVQKEGNININVIHRKQKTGLIQAILEGVSFAKGGQVLIMDADFSHPPEIIPKIIEISRKNDVSIIIASRYTNGGSIQGWSLKRRILSLAANHIARRILNVFNVKDPMSGFFAFPRELIQNTHFDTKGYKILLELLVKERNAKIIEIPYAFTDRKSGKSKMNLGIILDYVQSVWQLYRYGKNANPNSFNKSARFFSKAARFFTVGASGLLVNYSVSILLSSGLFTKMWYMESTLVGIFASITSNFILNKIWTFDDRNFSPFHLIKQYLSFLCICSLGAIMQLGIVYGLVETGNSYELSLLFAVIVSSISNFILNKILTFKEKIYD